MAQRVQKIKPMGCFGDKIVPDRCDLRAKDVILFATMDANRGESNIARLEEKVRLRGARVIECFTIATKNKSP